MRCIATLVFFCGCFASYGQATWGVRLNQNTDFYDVTYREGTTRYQESKVGFARISASVFYNTNKITHDVEFFVPQIKSSRAQFPWPQVLYRIPEYDNEITSYSIRYAISRSFSINNSFAFTLGGALNPFYLKVTHVSNTQNYFDVSQTYTGVSVNVVPGISVKASKHLSFVFDSPLKIADMYDEIYDVKNPAIPVRQQKTHTKEGDFFMSSFTLRFGVAYQFKN